MGDVIDLRPTPHHEDVKEPEEITVKVWTCECGCKLYYLALGGTIICSTCHGTMRDAWHIDAAPVA